VNNDNNDTCNACVARKTACACDACVSFAPNMDNWGDERSQHIKPSFETKGETGLGGGIYTTRIRSAADLTVRKKYHHRWWHSNALADDCEDDQKVRRQKRSDWQLIGNWEENNDVEIQAVIK